MSADTVLTTWSSWAVEVDSVDARELLREERREDSVEPTDLMVLVRAALEEARSAAVVLASVVALVSRLVRTLVTMALAFASTPLTWPRTSMVVLVWARAEPGSVRKALSRRDWTEGSVTRPG